MWVLVVDVVVVVVLIVIICASSEHVSLQPQEATHNDLLQSHLEASAKRHEDRMQRYHCFLDLMEQPACGNML